MFDALSLIEELRKKINLLIGFCREIKNQNNRIEQQNDRIEQQNADIIDTLKEIKK